MRCLQRTTRSYLSHCSKLFYDCVWDLCKLTLSLYWCQEVLENGCRYALPECQRYAAQYVLSIILYTCMSQYMVLCQHHVICIG